MLLQLKHRAGSQTLHLPASLSSLHQMTLFPDTDSRAKPALHRQTFRRRSKSMSSAVDAVGSVTSSRVVHLHRRRCSSRALAIVGGEAHASLCFLDRVRLLLQRLHSVDCQTCTGSTAHSRRTGACAPCPFGAPACWPRSRRTLRTRGSSSGLVRADPLWASHS